MLKAIEILKTLKFKYESCGHNKNEIYEAIVELEALQLNLYSKKCEDISNMFKDATNENITFKKLSSALNIKTCDNCINNIDVSFLLEESKTRIINICNDCLCLSNWEPK